MSTTGPADAGSSFTCGQVVIVDEPGMGYGYNGVIVQREGSGAFTVMDAAGHCMEHDGHYLRSAGWSVPADERPFAISSQ